MAAASGNIKEPAANAALNLNIIGSKLQNANENIWMRLGALSELMHDFDKAVHSYENVLRLNQSNAKALIQIASIYRLKEHYAKVRFATDICDDITDGGRGDDGG